MAHWPYEDRSGGTCRMEADVLVLGGGVAGCMATYAAAKRGQKVVLVEKGAAKRSGAGRSGCDHWESAATNPCSSVTPEELLQAMMDDISLTHPLMNQTRWVEKASLLKSREGE